MNIGVYQKTKISYVHMSEQEQKQQTSQNDGRGIGAFVFDSRFDKVASRCCGSIFVHRGFEKLSIILSETPKDKDINYTFVTMGNMSDKEAFHLAEISIKAWNKGRKGKINMVHLGEWKPEYAKPDQLMRSMSALGAEPSHHQRQVSKRALEGISKMQGKV